MPTTNMSNNEKIKICENVKPIMYGRYGCIRLGFNVAPWARARAFVGNFSSHLRSFMVVLNGIKYIRELLQHGAKVQASVGCNPATCVK